MAGPYAAASTAPIVEGDIAAVAARALLTDELVGQRIPLTGPQAFTNTELVEVIGAVLGRPLQYREVPPEVVRQRFIGLGFPAEFADAYMAMLAETLNEPALVTHDVEKILGRPASPFAQWVSRAPRAVHRVSSKEPDMSDPRPPRYLKPMNKVMMAVQKLGIPTGPAMVLTVPGRKSGQPRSTPMTPFEFQGGLYVVAGYPGADWAANARAAGTRHAGPGSAVPAGQHRRADRRASTPGVAGVSRQKCRSVWRSRSARAWSATERPTNSRRWRVGSPSSGSIRARMSLRPLTPQQRSEPSGIRPISRSRAPGIRCARPESAAGPARTCVAARFLE